MFAEKHNGTQPPDSKTPHMRPCMQAAVSLCLLAALCACPPPCRAQEPASQSDNQTLQVTFLSLKPGNAIGPSRLRLHTDGTLDFRIDGETLSGVQGAWTQKESRFSATVDFSLDRRTGFHYRLVLDGYSLTGLYGGRARLSEYNAGDRLMQEVDFLFYAGGSGPQTEKDSAR